MTKTSTTRVHNRKTVNLRKKLLCVMAVSAASLLSSSALANTETISVPQIVNETTLQDVGKHLASYNEFFLTELGAIWVDGVQLDLSNIKLTGNHVRLQVGGPDFPYQNAKAISSGGSLTVGSITATGTNIIHVIGTTNRDSTLTVKGDINASNLDVWIDGKNTNTNTKISVEGNFTETEDSRISAQYNGILEVKGGLTVNISDKGSFYIANSKNVPISLKVGKDFTFSNHITKNNNFDPNGLFFDASIGTAAAEIGGDFILQGANDAPTTYFQIANSKGAGVKAANIQVIGSDNNTTSLLFSRSSIVNVGSGNGVIELRPDGNNSKVQLFIGESDYKAKSILASELKMNQSEGSDGIFVFLNNNVQDLKQNFVFVPKITGHGHIENLGGYNVLRSAESTYTGKTVVTDGTLILAAPTGAGQSNIEVNTEAGNTTKGLYLQFQSDAGPIENKISGDGVIRVAGEVSVKSSDISDYHGEWDVLGKLKTVDGSFTTSSQWGTGNVNIEPQGSVVVTNNSNGSLFVFDNTLSGSGTLLVNFSGSGNGTDLYTPTFKIQQGTTSEFTGMVELAGEKNKKVVYILDSDELSTSGIRVSDNSVLSVGRDDSSKETFTLGKLDIAGGELNIGDIQTGSPTSNKTIRVTKKLNADGEGTVRIDTSAGFINAVPTTESELETLPLMEQDDGLQKTSMMLVNAKGAEIIGSGGGLSLVDQNGKVLSNALTSKVIQNGVHVANAGYDWKLTTSGSEEEASGLYLNYGLTQVELLGQGDSALILYATPGLPENSLANDLSAKVVGSGDLKISAVGETVSLSNPENTYTGGTFVMSDSTLKLGADSALGATEEVNLAERAILNLNDHSQEIGKLTVATDAQVDMADSSQLTVKEGGTVSAGGLKGSGNLIVQGGTLEISGANADFHASTSIKPDAAVEINSVLGLGDNEVQDNGTLTLKNIEKPSDGGNPLHYETYLTYDEFANTLIGSGKLNAENSSFALTGKNSDFNGTIEVGADSDIAVFKNSALGEAKIENNGKLDLLFDEEYSYIDNFLSGNGTTVVHGYATVSNNSVQNNSYTGDWLVLGKLSSDKGAHTSQELWGSGKTELNWGNIEIFVSDDGFTYDNSLTGHGALWIYSDPNAKGINQEFKFDNNLKDNQDFIGTMVLDGKSGGNLFYVLNHEDNLGSLGVVVKGGAELKTDGTSDPATLESLMISGGSIDFEKEIQFSDTESSAQILIDGDVLSGLDVSSTGTVKVKMGDQITLPEIPDTESNNAIMEHDDYIEKAPRIPLIQLKDENKSVVNGYAGGIELFVNGQSTLSPDEGGSLSTSVKTVSILQGSLRTEVAKGSYGFQLSTLDSSKDSNGLYLTYGLNEVQLLGKDDNALTLLPSESTASGGKDLRAKVTGDGDLRIDAPNDYISLSNPNNDYTGKTFVDPDSTLKLLADSALGSTSEVLLEENATLDLANTSQTVGRLNAGENAKVHFGEPKESDDRLDQKSSQLTIREGGQIVSADTLTGSGTLTVESGTLDIEASNPNLHTNNVLFTEAKVNMKSSSGLGDGTIELDGELNLNGVNDGPIQNQLSGMGRLNLFSSDLALTADNSGFEGDIQIDPQSELTVSNASNLGKAAVSNNGYLIINNSDDWTLSNDITGSGSVRKEGHGTLSITNDTLWNGKTEINEGELHLGTPDSVVTSNSSSVVIGQNGTLSGFAVLKGDLVHAGTLNIGTQDSEPSVFLVEGNYIGNNGLINFKGYLEGDSSPVDKLIVRGSTSGTSRVVVTNMGTMGGRTSKGIELIHVDGQSDGTFIQEGRIVAGAFEYRLVRGEGANSNHWYLKTEDDQVRPEIGSYIANEESVQTSFVTRQLDRGGKTEYTDFFTGEKKSTSLWLRQVGRYNSWQDSSGNTKTRSNRYISQIGGDIAAWTDAENQQALHLGLMAGYAHSRAISHSVVNGQRSIGKTDGYGLGMYATWFEDEINQQGAYVDAWFNYSWFKSSVNGNDNPKEKYRSRGLTGSLEAGYTQKLGSNNYGDWYVQPQAQVIWMGVTTPNRTEKNGTHVRFNGHGNIQSRIGARFYIQGRVPGSDQGIGSFQLYTDVNWIHNTRKFGVTMNQDGFTQAGASNLAELKFGGERKVGKNLHLWGNVGSRFGSHDYRELSATIGAKFVF